MPNFEYSAKDGPERLVEGVIEAPSETAAIEKISELGYVPVRVRPHASDRKAEAASRLFTSARKKLRQTYFFSRHLASLVKSGVSILKAIWILAEQESDAGFKRILESLASEIKDGKTLSQAMQKMQASSLAGAAFFSEAGWPGVSRHSKTFSGQASRQAPSAMQRS